MLKIVFTTGHFLNKKDLSQKINIIIIIPQLTIFFNRNSVKREAYSSYTPTHNLIT